MNNICTVKNTIFFWHGKYFHLLDNLSIDRTEPQILGIFWNTLRTQSHDDVSGHLLSVLPGLLARGLLAAPLPALLCLPPRALLVSALPMSLRHRESWGYLKWIKYISSNRYIPSDFNQLDLQTKHKGCWSYSFRSREKYYLYSVDVPPVMLLYLICGFVIPASFCIPGCWSRSLSKFPLEFEWSNRQLSAPIPIEA